MHRTILMMPNNQYQFIIMIYCGGDFHKFAYHDLVSNIFDNKLTGLTEIVLVYCSYFILHITA